jgi:hypothetical protein
MRRFAFLLIILLALPMVTSAEEVSLLQPRDQASLDFEKVTVEQNLKAKLLSVIQPMFPDARFNLEVAINYKTKWDQKKKIGTGEDGKDYIELGKYGVVAPTVSDEVLHTDFISHVGYIRITFIAYQYLDESQVKMLKDLTKKVVDIVPVWRLKIDMVIPPATAVQEPAHHPMGVSKVFSQPDVSNWNTAWSFGFAALIFAIAFGFVFNFNRLREELRSVVEELRRGRVNSNNAQKQEPVYQSRPAPEYYTRSANPEKFSESEEIVVETVQHHQHSHHEHDEQTVNVSPINQAFENLATSGPQSEDSAFEALVREGKFETLREAASSYFPASLMLMLPPTILTAGLDLMGVHEKSGLILSMDGVNREILLRCLNPKAREYVDHELQKYQTDHSMKSKIDKNGEQYWKEFVDIVRGLLRTNENFAAEANPLLEQWLDAKARGVRHAG